MFLRIAEAQSAEQSGIKGGKKPFDPNIIIYPFSSFPHVIDNRSLGEYYLNDSGLFVVPDPWKPAIDTERLGSFIANEEQVNIPR